LHPFPESWFEQQLLLKDFDEVRLYNGIVIIDPVFPEVFLLGVERGIKCFERACSLKDSRPAIPDSFFLGFENGTAGGAS
jgi:hypothetical protein